MIKKKVIRFGLSARLKRLTVVTGAARFVTETVIILPGPGVIYISRRRYGEEIHSKL